jgi:TPR repeat protein
MKRFLPLLAAAVALAAPARGAYLIFPDGEAPLKGDAKTAYDFYKKGNYAEALRLFRADAARGTKEAQFALGLIYQEGKAVEASAEQAENWWRKAAQQGHVASQFNLSLLLFNMPGRAEEGLEWLRKAADAGSGPAMLNLGNMNLSGTGME